MYGMRRYEHSMIQHKGILFLYNMSCLWCNKFINNSRLLKGGEAMMA